jgi:hypothetical protein
MSWSAPIKLRAFAADLAISRACLRAASPAVERPLRVVTWLADERILLGAATVFWSATRLSGSRALRREADQMLCSVLKYGRSNASAAVLGMMAKPKVKRRSKKSALLRFVELFAACPV